MVFREEDPAMETWLGKELFRLKNTVVWSLNGWRAAWASEKTLRQWTLANVLSAALAFGLDLSNVERALILGFGLLILVAELINTAVETTVDRIGMEEHELSRKAKDIASACVAMSALTAGVIWLVILFG